MLRLRELMRLSSTELPTLAPVMATTIYSGNIGAEGSSGGVQQRTGGTTNDNLFLRSPIAITCGSVQNEEPPFNGTEHRSI
jgi:hypothetical protein